MSHIVEINTQVRDPAAVRAACRRLGLAEPKQGTVRLFSESISGFTVRLPDWRYPVVFDLAEAKVRFDNFGGQWGAPREFDRFMQAYAVEKARIEAHRKGHTLTEQPLADGSIKLTIEVAGGTL